MGGTYRQSTETEVCMSLHLQADQQRKSFNAQVVSLNNWFVTRSFSVHGGTTKVLS